MSPSPHRHPWVLALLEKLLKNDEALCSLFATNPFPETPPRYVRVIRYRYEYTEPEQRRETGRWWTRERVGTYVSPVSTETVERQSAHSLLR
jgi:hypothetical protein